LSYPFSIAHVDGGGVRSLTATGCTLLKRFGAISGGLLYFEERHNDGTRTAVSRIAWSATGTTTCTTVVSNAAGISSYFIDETNAQLWVNAGGALDRVALSSTTATLVEASSHFVPVVADATAIYGWENTNGGSSAYKIVQRDRSSGTHTTLASFVTEPTLLHVDATYVYYASDGALFEIGKTSAGSPVQINGPSGAWAMGADGSDVVWWRLDEPNIYRMPIGGGSVTTVTTGSLAVRGVTWDGTNYYFMQSPKKLGYEGLNDWNLYTIPK
jgi:hypothetical protein